MQRTFVILSILVLILSMGCDEKTKKKAELCGNGILDEGEQCDQTELGNQSCLSLGYYGGTLSCNEACQLDVSSCEAQGRCGDGVLQEDHEECDGELLGGLTCDSFGYYGGQLACSDCEFDLGGCQGTCGDNVVQTPQEVCDGNDFSGATCADYGFYTGDLACTATCDDILTTGCSGFCGDGQFNDGFEECDGEHFGQSSCQDVGRFFGQLDCSESCELEEGTCRNVEIFGSTSWGWTWKIIRDAEQNIYLAGGMDGDFDGQTNNGDGDGFVSKYDRFGNRLWTRFNGSSNDDYFLSVAVDAEGNVYAAGSAVGPVDGQAHLGSTDILLVKYDNSGNRLWTRLWGNEFQQQASEVLVDADGFLYVIGYTWGGFDGQPNVGEYDVFVIKADSDGNKIWTRIYGTPQYDNAQGAALDPEGHLVLTGSTEGQWPGQTALGFSDILVLKIDNDGELLWARQLGTDGFDFSHAVAIHPSGNIALSGMTTGALPGYSRMGSNDIVAFYLDSSGNTLWARQWGATTWADCYSVFMDGLGHIYLAGTVETELNGQTMLGQSDVFVIQVDLEGNTLSTRILGTEGEEYAYAGISDEAGNLWITGNAFDGWDGQPEEGVGTIFLTYIPASN